MDDLVLDEGDILRRLLPQRPDFLHREDSLRLRLRRRLEGRFDPTPHRTRESKYASSDFFSAPSITTRH